MTEAGAGAEGRLVEFIAKALVDHPESVKVTVERTGDAEGRILIEADPSDYGKIIGKRGRIIHSIRALVSVASREARVRWQLDLPERAGGHPDEHEFEEDGGGGDRT